MGLYKIFLRISIYKNYKIHRKKRGTLEEKHDLSLPILPVYMQYNELRQGVNIVPSLPSHTNRRSLRRYHVCGRAGPDYCIFRRDCHMIRAQGPIWSSTLQWPTITKVNLPAQINPLFPFSSQRETEKVTTAAWFVATSESKANYHLVELLKSVFLQPSTVFR